MKAFLITMAILLVGFGVIGVVWWLMRRASPPTAAPVSPAVSPGATPGEQDAGPEKPAAPEEPVAARVAPAPPEPTTSAAATSHARAAEPAPSAEAAPEPEVPAGPYGPGSARPLPDGSAPTAEFTVKGNASSKLYHAPESPYYKRTKAEAWFRTAEDAEAAGFQHWNSRRRKK